MNSGNCQHDLLQLELQRASSLGRLLLSCNKPFSYMNVEFMNPNHDIFLGSTQYLSIALYSRHWIFAGKKYIGTNCKSLEFKPRSINKDSSKTRLLEVQCSFMSWFLNISKIYVHYFSIGGNQVCIGNSFSMNLVSFVLIPSIALVDVTTHNKLLYLIFN